MNTRKQVLVMVALMMFAVIGLGVYSAWDPDRNIEAGEDFNEKVAGRGSILFARNCRLCHGDVGEGGALGGRLAAAPALDRPDLQGFVDSLAKLSADLNASVTEVRVSDGSKFKSGVTILIDSERMLVKKVDGNVLTVVRGTGLAAADGHTSQVAIQLLSPAALKDKVKLITNTVSCGRVGSAMPAWAQDQNGPLSDEQIRQLVVLTSEGHWDRVKEEVDVEDTIPAKLQREVDESTISFPVTDLSYFFEQEAIRIGEERVLITGVPKFDSNDKDKSGVIQVQRGVQGSVPLPHSPEDEVFKFPLVAEPATNLQSCGQIARPAAPAAPPSEKPCTEPCQTVNLVAVGVAFDKKEIGVKIGGNVRIHFTNNDAGIQHNVAVYQSSTTFTAVSSGSVGTTFAGPSVIDDVVFATPAAGSYFFRCDVHPTIMTGNFVVAP